MIELADGDFVQCVWLADTAGMDFLGCCYRHDGEWALRYRFRYHSPQRSDPWDGKDQKNWYAFAVPDGADLAKLVAAADFAFGSLPNFRRIDVCGDQTALLDILAKEDRTHIRTG